MEGLSYKEVIADYSKGNCSSNTTHYQENQSDIKEKNESRTIPDTDQDSKELPWQSIKEVDGLFPAMIVAKVSKSFERRTRRKTG